MGRKSRAKGEDIWLNLEFKDDEDEQVCLKGFYDAHLRLLISCRCVKVGKHWTETPKKIHQLSSGYQHNSHYEIQGNRRFRLFTRLEYRQSEIPQTNAERLTEWGTEAPVCKKILQLV